MSGQHSSKTGLFLMEIIVVILFFSVCAAICVQIFANSRQLADRSQALNDATIVAQSGAEVYRAVAGDLDGVREILGGTVEDDRCFLVVCDDDYLLEIRKETASDLSATVEVSYVDSRDLIFSLRVMACRGGGQS